MMAFPAACGALAPDQGFILHSLCCKADSATGLAGSSVDKNTEPGELGDMARTELVV